MRQKRLPPEISIEESEEQRLMVESIWNEWSHSKPPSKLTWREMVQLCFFYYDMIKDFNLAGKIVPFNIAVNKLDTYAGNMDSMMVLAMKACEPQ